MKLNFSHAKVLVVGDVMLDSYWQGSTNRISPEAPVPVVHVDDMTHRIGGSGNVALNVSTLGAQVELFALIGDDKEGLLLSNLLTKSHIKNHCQIEPSIPTTTKLRVLSQHQQLIRLDFEQPHQHVSVSSLIEQFEVSLKQADMVVVSDYAKGLLEDAQPFISLSNKHNVKVLIDPKKDSFENYSGAWLLTPNLKEFEAVVGQCLNKKQLVEKAQEVIKQFNFGGLLITQGSDGMTLVMGGEEAIHFPTHAQDVYDVTGAGDTVIASLATAVASGQPIKDAVELSCKAAGIVVSRVGTSSVSVADLEALNEIIPNHFTTIQSKLLDQKSLLNKIDLLRNDGQKIVFTNGCFDLLHAGHVTYLEKAAQLGDVLIVAVNSDESVRLLKGDSRPINTVLDRMTVLASLASVSMVVEFTEETPEALICSIKPDVLVKGGDYKIEEIAGRTCAQEVILVDLVDGLSTTKTLEKLNINTKIS